MPIVCRRRSKKNTGGVRCKAKVQGCRRSSSGDHCSLTLCVGGVKNYIILVLHIMALSPGSISFWVPPSGYVVHTMFCRKEVPRPRQKSPPYEVSSFFLGIYRDFDFALCGKSYNNLLRTKVVVKGQDPTLQPMVVNMTRHLQYQQSFRLVARKRGKLKQQLVQRSPCFLMSMFVCEYHCTRRCRVNSATPRPKGPA